MKLSESIKNEMNAALRSALVTLSILSAAPSHALIIDSPASTGPGFGWGLLLFHKS